MKPPPFAYVAAETVDEAVELLEQHGGDAKILAGGQSLIPLMNLRLARPSVLVDISRIRSLGDITNGDVLTIGATATQVAVRESPDVQASCPVLSDAMRYVGHVATQSRGTFGGSAAHADPAAEIPALLVALEAELVARSATGERGIPADEFFQGYFTTALSEGEVLTSIRLPRQNGVRAAFLEVSRRQGDFALVGVAVAARMESDGIVRSSRVVVAGVSGTPKRMEMCEQLLEGQSLETSILAEAGAVVADEVEPSSDVHASSSYRRHVAGVLVRRALEELKN